MPKKKVNKSAFVRAQPASMSAKDVVKKAKAAGMSLTDSHVYTIRSAARTKQAKGRGKGTRKVGRPQGSKNLKSEITGELTAIRRAVFQHGFNKVEALLAEMKKSVGL